MDTGATIPRRDLEGFNLWLPGIIIEILGGAALVAGAVLAANDSETLRWTGVGLAIGGGTFMVGGLVMALIGGLRMRRDRARQLTEQLNARLVPLLRATDGGGMVDLAGRF